MYKTKIIFNKDSNIFESTTIIEMTDEEVSEYTETSNEIKLLNNLLMFRVFRKEILSKYDIYSMHVIRGKIQENTDIEQWYQDILDFPLSITKETSESDWPETPDMIKNL